MAHQALLLLSCLAGATGFTALHHTPMGMQGMPLRRASVAACSHFAPFAPARHIRVFGDTALSMLELETSELRRGDLKDRRGVKWTEVEERTLLAAMAAAGIAREEGAEVSGYLSFIPFAKTVNHLFLEHRNEMGIAQKARILLLKGPVANKGNENSAGAGVSGLIGVSQDRRKSMDKNRWMARVWLGGKDHYLGLYATAPEAGWARDRVAVAVLGEPSPGATWKQLFNYPDEAAALVSPDGALQPLSKDAHKSLKKLYAAAIEGEGATMHPMMLELWRLHGLSGVDAE
mmetsp:Transcript_57150/g.135720  ORF Transcript_57150/g.135720 Transcript_57150/m.135720 type:complete len:289 (+) Transcript_57150:174-1040(+)